VDGTQYVSVLVGFGGAAVAYGGGSSMAQYGWGYRAQLRQLLTFAVGSDKQMPDVGEPTFAKVLTPADFTPDDQQVDHGQHVYKSSCAWCHGAGAVSGGYTPDLRASEAVVHTEQFKAIVQEGALAPNGMPRFKNLSDDDLKALQNFIRKRALDAAQPPSN
jgi:quinohemoprotein ethanol dehydrogenase